MKAFGLAVLAAIGGELTRLFGGGMMLIETFSSDQHDKSIEAAMTGLLFQDP
jgi:hypothetical protein